MVELSLSLFSPWWWVTGNAGVNGERGRHIIIIACTFYTFISRAAERDGADKFGERPCHRPGELMPASHTFGSRHGHIRLTHIVLSPNATKFATSLVPCSASKYHIGGSTITWKSIPRRSQPFQEISLQIKGNTENSCRPVMSVHGLIDTCVRLPPHGISCLHAFFYSQDTCK